MLPTANVDGYTLELLCNVVVGVISFPRRDLRFVGDEHMPRIRVNHELGVEAHLRQQC